MSENPIKVLAEKTKLIDRPIRVLAVDDEEFNLEILMKHLKKAGYESVGARDGEEAWEYLNQHPGEIDILLLDKMMPRMDGMEVLRRVKAHPDLKEITVIMQTASVGTQELISGISAGAYYYLTKPYAAEVLISIVNAAAKDHKNKQALKKELFKKDLMFGIITSAEFELQTIDQARALAAFISNFYSEPARVIVGLAALLMNAIEHGNLAIGYEEKSRLVSEGAFETEVENRLASPAYASKKVRVSLNHTPEKITVHIRDDGTGFDWQSYIDFDPRRVTDPNGRGIAMANIMVPGAIEFIGKGNEVKYIINLKDQWADTMPQQLKSENFRVVEKKPEETQSNF